MSLSYSNPCTTLLNSHHSHSRPVYHASDAILYSLPEAKRRVLEGGSLIHRIQWQPGTRLCQNSEIVTDFTTRHYGSATTGVFEGCEEESPIKYDTHQRRGHNIHRVVSFTAERDLSGKKEEFLSRDAYNSD